MAAEALLAGLDALVRAQPDFRGLMERITICAKSPDGDAFWTLRLGPSLCARFAEGVPRDTDALLVLDRSQSESILREGRLAGRMRVAGDRRLLIGFFERYVQTKRALDVRLQMGGR